MTNKSKQQSSATALIRCPVCGCLLLKRDEAKHKRIMCEILQTKSGGADIATLAKADLHGFILDSVMCLLSDGSRHSTSNNLEVAPSLFQQVKQLLPFHPVCVRGLNEADSDYETLMLFPRKEMQMFTCNRSSPCMVRLIASENMFYTDCVRFGCLNEKSFQKSDEFIEYVTNELLDRCLYIGETIRMQYFGQIVYLCVQSATKREPVYCSNAFEVTDDDAESLSADVSSCSLNDSVLSNNTSFSAQSPASSDRSTPSRGGKMTEEITLSLPPAEFNEHVFKVTVRTSVVFGNMDTVGYIPSMNALSFDRIGGLADVKRLLRDELTRLPSSTYRGASFLLVGFSGTGKSSMLNAAGSSASRENVKVFSLSIERLGKQPSEAERCVLELGAAICSYSSAALLLIDNIELFSSDSTDATRRLNVCLCHVLDSLSARESVLVLAATNSAEQLMPDLRRRFDRELEAAVPDLNERLEILYCHDQSLKEEHAHWLSQNTHGYTGSDLVSLVKHCSRLERLDEATLSLALAAIRPSAVREITLEVAQVHWKDIGGMEEVKLKLQQVVEWPMLHAEAFARLGLKAPKGVLMYGPPGCSKTMIARALATESRLNFLAVKGPELFSKWVGESERAVRELFRKARRAAPAIVFFDEIDALATNRSAGEKGKGSNNVSERVLGQLLTELDGLGSNSARVVVIAATNRPDSLDAALLRPGRFDRLVYVPLPDAESRREICGLQLARMPVANVDCIVDKLATAAAGMSGAEIVQMCQEAGLHALQRDITTVTIEWADFEYALSNATRGVTEELLTIYSKFRDGIPPSLT